MTGPASLAPSAAIVHVPPQARTLAATIAALAVLATSFSRFAPMRALLLALPLAALTLLVVQPSAVRLSRRLPLALLLFVGWSVSSLTWSADLHSSVRQLVDLVPIAVVAIASGALLGLDDLHRALGRLYRWIVVATFVALVVAPAWSTQPAVDGAPGWHAMFSHKNGLGSFAVLALVAFWSDGGLRRRRLWAFAALVLVVGSQSSTALALVLLSVAVLTWRRAFVTLRAPAQRLAYLLASCALVVGGGVVLSAQIDLVTSLFGRSATFSGRTDIWSSTWRAVQERPLEGHGFGGVWSNPVPPTAHIWKELRFEAFHAHNGFLDLALQVGVVGLILFVLTVGGTWLRTSRQRGPGADWARATIAVIVVNAMVESGPFFGGGMLLLALLTTVSAQRVDGSATGRPLSAGSVMPRARRLASSSR